GIASLVTFASPVDTRAAIPFGLPEELVLGGLGLLARPLPRGSPFRAGCRARGSSVGVAGRGAHAARLAADVGLGVARSAVAATRPGGG
ncbi:MAG: hypothetical protein M3Y36_11445, partial [Actinomycetota bacterium]|nr:hypothetical protein [Actinomycetota bacterium]